MNEQIIKSATVKEILNDKISDFLNCKTERCHAKAGRYTVQDTADNTLEISIDNKYFISIGKLAEDTFEVFTLHYNKNTKTTWEDWENIPADEDHLCQHKCFSSFWRAFSYAFKAAEKGVTPREINYMW